MEKKNKTLGGILLVSGTAIGAGMLALPVTTGLAGLFPSILIFLLCWMLMTYTAFLMLEVNLWFEGSNNLISMAKHTLGRFGEIFSWTTYLFLLYALTTAYITGGGATTVHLLYLATGLKLPLWLGSLSLLLFFSFFVYRGTAAVDRINRILIIGLVLAYAGMVFLITPHVDTQKLFHVDWNSILLAVSLVVTSFGFHVIIPTLSEYLKKDTNKLIKVIFIGSIIPLIVYLIWEVLILGILPHEGETGLWHGFKKGIDSAQLLSMHFDNIYLAVIASVFSFCAIFTSFLGVSLSLSDFLVDGLNIKRSATGKLFLYALTFLPPLTFSLTNPRAFFTALEYAGAFGVVTLLGILPALMAWRGRYVYRFASKFTVPGGKIALVFVILVCLGIIILEIFNKLSA